MILLDTDHLSALKYEESERVAELSSRMLALWLVPGSRGLWPETLPSLPP